MKSSGSRFSLFAILACFIAICLVAPQVAQAAEARVPHNAFDKVLRPDLAAPLSTQGEIRVVVGLQTADEIARPVDTTPDADKAAAVSARQSRLLERLAGHNVRNVTRLRLHHFIALTVDGDALNALLADPEVTSVTEDRPVYPVLYDTPGITRADKAWAEGFRGAGQTVAIIDTGVDKTHPFFSGKVVAEACYSNPQGSNTSYCPGGVSSSTATGSGVPCPDYNLVCWHGTHVAGIATGRTGVLTATTGGIAPDANVIPIQVFQRTCSGTTCAITAYDSDIIAALDHVYSLRATFNIASANLSLGGDLFTSTCDSSFPGYKTVIDSLRSANIATVIASGNSGSASALTAPGCISSAISVGSTNKDNTISSFSDSASFLSLLAPGGSITSSLPLAFVSGGFGTASGTSMATPHVAGAWAVLKSATPTATVSAVLSALQNTGLPLTDPRNGITKSLIQIGDTPTQFGALGVVLGQNTPPSVALTSPTNGASFPPPATITLSAAATANRASITRVEFFQGTTKIGEALAAPYSITWNSVPQGSYTLTARASDNIGGTATSTPVSISVNTTSTTTTFQITGTVTASGSPFSGINFTAGTGTTCTSSNASGQYSCTVPQGFTGSVTPSLSGYTFTPPSRSYANVNANQTAQDYTAAAGSFANGGFETPTLAAASYQYNPSGSSWTFTGSAGIQSNGSVWVAPSAPEGQQTTFLQNVSQISQSFNLAAGNYTVSFYAARRSYGGIQSVQVSIDGVAIGAPITPAGTTFALYTTSSFNVATTGVHTLQLSGTNGTGDNTAFIDVVVVTTVAAAGSFANGGFETPTLAAASYQYNPSGSSWTFTGSAGIQSNGSVWVAPSAPEGQQTTFLQNVSQISQSFNLAAGNYTVSFYAARRSYGGIQSVQVSIDGVAIGAPITPAGTTFALYTTSSFNVATTGVHTLQLSGTNGTGDNTAFIDVVVVTTVAAAGSFANGGFETPTLAAASYQYNPPGSSWTFTGSAGIQSNGSVWVAPSAPEGQQTTFLQNVSQISQSFNLAAGNYTVSFYAARRSYGGIQSVQVSIDGVAIGAPITPAGTTFALYTTSSFNVATTGVHTLQISGTNGTGDNTAFIDAVVVSP